jgi:hypothetical protein
MEAKSWVKRMQQNEGPAPFIGFQRPLDRVRLSPRQQPARLAAFPALPGVRHLIERCSRRFTPLSPKKAPIFERFRPAVFALRKNLLFFEQKRPFARLLK